MCVYGGGWSVLCVNCDVLELVGSELLVPSAVLLLLSEWGLGSLCMLEANNN